MFFQSQIVVLAAQISWSEDIESALQVISNAGDNNLEPLQEVLTAVESTLTVLADSVLQEQPPLRRKKLEHLVWKKHFYLKEVFLCISSDQFPLSSLLDIALNWFRIYLNKWKYSNFFMQTFYVCN